VIHIKRTSNQRLKEVIMTQRQLFSMAAARPWPAQGFRFEATEVRSEVGERDSGALKKSVRCEAGSRV